MDAEKREHLEMQLSAYLDDELPVEERAEVEVFLASDPEAQSLLAQLRATAKAVRFLPRARASEDLIDSLRERLERKALLDEGPSAEIAAPRVGIRSGRWVAAAAMIALACLAGYLTWTFRPEKPAPDQYVMGEPKAKQPAGPETAVRSEAREESSKGLESAARKPEVPSAPTASPSPPAAFGKELADRVGTDNGSVLAGVDNPVDATLAPRKQAPTEPNEPLGTGFNYVETVEGEVAAVRAGQWSPDGKSKRSSVVLDAKSDDQIEGEVRRLGDKAGLGTTDGTSRQSLTPMEESGRLPSEEGKLLAMGAAYSMRGGSAGATRPAWVTANDALATAAKPPTAQPDEAVLTLAFADAEGRKAMIDSLSKGVPLGARSPGQRSQPTAREKAAAGDDVIEGDGDGRKLAEEAVRGALPEVQSAAQPPARSALRSPAIATEHKSNERTEGMTWDVKVSEEGIPSASGESRQTTHGVDRRLGVYGSPASAVGSSPATQIEPLKLETDTKGIAAVRLVVADRDALNGIVTALDGEARRGRFRILSIDGADTLSPGGEQFDYHRSYGPAGYGGMMAGGMGMMGAGQGGYGMGGMGSMPGEQGGYGGGGYGDHGLGDVTASRPATFSISGIADDLSGVEYDDDLGRGYSDWADGTEFSTQLGTAETPERAGVLGRNEKGDLLVAGDSDGSTEDSTTLTMNKLRSTWEAGRGERPATSQPGRLFDEVSASVVRRYGRGDEDGDGVMDNAPASSQPAAGLGQASKSDAYSNWGRLIVTTHPADRLDNLVGRLDAAPASRPAQPLTPATTEPASNLLVIHLRLKPSNAAPAAELAPPAPAAATVAPTTQP